MRRAIPVFLVMLMTLASPLSLIDEFGSHNDFSADDSGADVHETPAWRIGDEWVYETIFDVADLIAQSNTSASVNSLTGDTTMEVIDIVFIDIDGIQTLAYEVDIEGDFTSGNSGATLNNQNGRLEIEYDGIDIIRVRDLAVISSEFSLVVNFFIFNLWIPLELADITFDSTYEPAREKYDFPLRTGDQWTSYYDMEVTVTGTSNYIDVNGFDSNETTNSTYQVTGDGTPSENGTSPQYTGCGDSHKISSWNGTGVSTGFEWYCEEVRYFVWSQIVNDAGFQIDWLLKSYSPADSGGVVASSSAGIRNAIITVDTEFLAILPNATEEVTGHFTVNSNNQVSKNLQLRYEIDNVIMSLTTDSNGEITPDLEVGDSEDDSPSSDDWTSNGVIVWDPVNKIIGVGTIVIDLSVVGIDLVAKPDSMIVTRNRDNISIILSQATGYNALPGDMIHFSVPAQNRGVLTSPATEMEITTPDGTTIRGNLPALAPYTEARVDVNWSVPLDAAIGNQTLSFIVDPDETVTADANRSNNAASLDIFVGRLPEANIILGDDVLTFENVSIDASGSFDADSGEVECFFEIQDGTRTEFIEAPNCQTNWSWADDGLWEIKLTVVDNEFDQVVLIAHANVLNRAPWLNFSAISTTVDAGGAITFDASDSGDDDTISPEGQQLVITWPGQSCDEGLFGDYCTIRPQEEGEHSITVMITDDDNASVNATLEYEVLNVAPTIGEMRLTINGIPYLPGEDGTWDIDEKVVAILAIDGSDTLSDNEGLLITWTPSDRDVNETITTSGPNSGIETSWAKSGIHAISAFVTDDDGVRSETIIGHIRVSNIAPVMDILPTQKALFEDEILNLSASAFDAADQEVLIFCWDLNNNVDSDESGNASDDCDVEGADLLYSWGTWGTRIITANVWDDDGVIDSSTVLVTIVNKPPSAVITEPEGGFIITQGESITFSAGESSDTPTDSDNLNYNWDDPNTLGSTNDGFGENFTILFERSGEFIINLTVTDDDGVSKSTSIIVKVNEKPIEGVLGISNTATVSALLGIIIVLLVGVLLMRGRSDSIPEPEFTSWDMPVQDEAAPSLSELSGRPQIPATGLPPGWTMEQWDYYGQQYLADLAAQSKVQVPTPVAEPIYENPQQTYVAQPMVQEPAPTPASQALGNLLDDLDF
ncbi:MAG: PKD domain-containing protein [Candidatus Poseidoniales archaeon]